MTAIGTAYSVRDYNGRILCHAPSATKSALDSRRKRAVREGFALMVAAAGLVNASGEIQDVVTGAFLPMADGTQRSDDMAVIERGHVIADESDGAFCPCNLVPENRGSNKGHGRRSLDPRNFRTSDPREAWFDVWYRNYARPAQRRVVVTPDTRASFWECCGVSRMDYCQC